MIKIKEAIIVEGKYDKIKLSSIVDALIIETHGFQIFKDKEQLNMIRKLANTRGILIMTDSDSAGFIIRNYLQGSIDPNKIKHAYISDIFGKERRKEKASKEGKLGVEGVPVSEIMKALQRAGVLFEEDAESQSERRMITKIDLFEFGLSGKPDSVQKRALLLKYLKLPEHLTPNALVKVLNGIMSYDEFNSILQKLSIKDKKS